MPSIRSRDVACAERSNVGSFEHLLQLLDVIDDALNIHAGPVYRRTFSLPQNSVLRTSNRSDAAILGSRTARQDHILPVNFLKISSHKIFHSQDLQDPNTLIECKVLSPEDLQAKYCKRRAYGNGLVRSQAFCPRHDPTFPLRKVRTCITEI